MKKTLLAIFMSLALILMSSTVNSQTSYAVSAHGGYSWLNGVVGAEAQFGHIGISGGWMPTKMPMSGDKISSIGFAVTAYTGKPDELSYYVSLGSASNGYRSQTTVNGSYVDEFSAPMTIVMVGCKSGNDVANFRIGGGYGWCEYGSAWTFEVTLGFVLFSNL